MTIILLTTNTFKLEEFQSILGARNIKVKQCLPEDDIKQQVTKLFESSPRLQFVMTECSDLYIDEDDKIDNPFDPDNNLQRVVNIGELTVYFRSREDFDEPGGSLVDGIDYSTYQAGISGYIDQSRTINHGFGWDAIFIVDETNLSYSDMRRIGLKNSVRNITLSDFINDHYDLLEQPGWKFFSFHSIDQVLNFTDIGKIISTIPFLTVESNSDLKRFGLDKLIQSVVNSGLYSKVSNNIRENIYWSPGLAPIPLVKKNDEIHQTTFFVHDLMHYLFPDLIYTGTHDALHQNVYVIHRMMSEALTLVLADMCFIDTVAKQGVEYGFEARKIYPLFQCLSLSGKTPLDQLRSLLWANTRYALAGDDSIFRSLKNPDVNDDVFENTLSAYKDKYASFFKADYIWTVHNYTNMTEQSEVFSKWSNAIGQELFASLNLSTLTDYVNALSTEKRSLDSLDNIITAIFEKNFTMLSSIINSDITPEDDAIIHSRAYSRYLIGQSLLFYKWHMVCNAENLGKAILYEIKRKKILTQSDFEAIDWHFEILLFSLRNKKLISFDDYRTWRNIHPLFSPFYVTYQGKNKVKGELSDIAKQLFAK